MLMVLGSSSKGARESPGECQALDDERERETEAGWSIELQLSLELSTCTRGPACVRLCKGEGLSWLGRRVLLLMLAVTFSGRLSNITFMAEKANNKGKRLSSTRGSWKKGETQLLPSTNGRPITRDRCVMKSVDDFRSIRIPECEWGEKERRKKWARDAMSNHLSHSRTPIQSSYLRGRCRLSYNYGTTRILRDSQGHRVKAAGRPAVFSL